MTKLKYLVESKVGTSSELIAYKREDPKGFEGLLEMAENEMMIRSIRENELEWRLRLENGEHVKKL